VVVAAVLTIAVNSKFPHVWAAAPVNV